MNVFILPFGKINLINSSIAEVIINDGVILDKSMVETYQNLFRTNLEPPFLLLVNNEHAYSYTFEAQLEMGKLKEIAFRAFVVYSQSAEMATQIIMDLNKNNNSNIRLFKERQSALDWLLHEFNNKSLV
ncbi:hypothetical protein [Psychroserpens sp. Hel_I_66]|uniref:hypothetical protein n=1 Tax=Psychroserpens sp. Hel_I_66 TaxID=1250004 RepID=UPI00068A32A1|nr:hypothetical protein [Psychroserpens sp. Hel_I_66]